MRILVACTFVALGACRGEILAREDLPGPGGTAAQPSREVGSGTSGAAAAAGPALARRLTNQEYRNVIADTLGMDLGPRAAALPDEAADDGFVSAAAALLPSPVRTRAYATLAAEIAEAAPWPALLARHAPCTTFAAACTSGFVESLGSLLYRRPLAAPERDTMLRLFAAAAAEKDDFLTGAKLVLQAMLQAPGLLYRLERQDRLVTGRAALDDFEVATRLSFLLWKSAPPPDLLEYARGGHLKANLADVARSMLRDPRARRGLHGFWDEWLQLPRVDRLVRSPARFPAWTPALTREARQETLDLFDRLVWTENADVMRVFTDRGASVPAGLARLYGVDTRAGGPTYPVAGVTGRGGLLTHASILALPNDTDEASLVSRGIFLLQKMLCGSVPPPPPQVPQLQTQGTAAALSDRERLARHSADPSCGGCHRAFDPLGYAFEQFDAVGAFRTMDAAGNPLTGAGRLQLDGRDLAFGGAPELAALLGASATVRACLVGKTLQYTLGRRLTPADQPLQGALVARFEKGGNRMSELLVALAASAAMTAIDPL